ncbi:MAG TPA: transposase family protein [Acidovorax sp.]|nr:transposase family protein [Acidovorax sp.]
MTLLQHLQLIPEPRLQRTRRHELQSILAVALCATIAGKALPNALIFIAYEAYGQGNRI